MFTILTALTQSPCETGTHQYVSFTGEEDETQRVKIDVLHLTQLVSAGAGSAMGSGLRTCALDPSTVLPPKTSFTSTVDGMLSQFLLQPL